MSLNGSFKETPFSDLVQFYDVSKQTALVRVRLGPGQAPAGAFLFAQGDLVSASLDGAEGREAVRRALRLRDGVFTVEAGALPTTSVPRERLRQVLMEEVVRLDEENRFVAPPPPAPSGGEAPLFAPPPRFPVGLLVAAGVALAAVVSTAAWFLTQRGGSAERRTPPGSAAGLASVPAAGPTTGSTGVRGVLDDAIVLGMVSSFSGSNKERGRAMQLGWDMAIAEVNESGGIHGRRIRLVVRDDGYDPGRTLAAMKEVVDGQGAFALVGNVGTATAAVAMPFAGEKNAVFFGALSGADLLRKSPPDRHVFNFRAGLRREADAAVRYLVDVRRTDPRRIAVLAQSDDFGASGRAGALARLAAYGVKPDDVLQLGYPRNTADVREAVARLHARARAFDAVVMVATYKPAATFVRKAKDAGLKLFYTTVSADSNGLAEELVESGAGYTRDVLVTQVVPVPTSHASTLLRYRKRLEQHAPGEKPGSTSLEAWIGAQIFLEGLRRAGRELDTPRLIAALEGMKDWDIGIGGRIGFGPNDHQGCDVVWGWMLQPDGSYRQVELE